MHLHGVVLEHPGDRGRYEGAVEVVGHHPVALGQVLDHLQALVGHQHL